MEIPSFLYGRVVEIIRYSNTEFYLTNKMFCGPYIYIYIFFSKWVEIALLPLLSIVCAMKKIV